MGEIKPVTTHDAHAAHVAHAAFSRRQFVVTALTASGGLALGIALSDKALAIPLATEPWSPDAVPADEISAWILIEPDETITVRIPHSEMGQGAATALPMFIAEELECDWQKIKGEFASANRNVREDTVYGDQNTVGSRGVRTAQRPMQQAGASARVRLVTAAARRWNVPVSECTVTNGVVMHAATERSLSYGRLAAEAVFITLDQEPAIKQPGEFKLIGTSVPRLDTPVKVDGSAKFGIDTVRPDMVYASIVSCPIFGGTVATIDDSAIQGRRGVIQVVRLDDAVAVVADSYWRADQALRALRITWNGGAAAGTNSAQFRQLYLDALDGPLVEAHNDGDARAVLAESAPVVDQVYEAPLLAHATMEPLNATVHLTAGRLDVWIGTQSPLRNLGTAAQEAGLRPDQVYIHNTFVGGGFGRRSRNDEMVHAIQVAKVIGDRPLKLIWSREQDMRQDRYRPQAAVRIRGSLNSDGTIRAIEARIAVGSISRSINGPDAAPQGWENQAVDGFDDTPYRIPNYHIGVVLKNTHVPVGFWRSVGGSQNCFFFESFIDELAYEAGKDPLEFRRAMMERRDFLGVIDKLKEVSNWGAPMAAGRGRGIAICENHRSIIGQVAEVTVNDAGEVRVDRIFAAVDCYHVVNPKIVESQIEGGIIFGLTAALYGEITVKDGAVEQGNFDTYPMVTLADAPDIEVYLTPTGGDQWAGVGECGLAPTAPAVTNAIFAATRKRVRRLPLKNVKLSELASL